MGAKTIEAIGANIGDINDLRKVRNKKWFGSVALVVHVLEACDLDTYAD